MNSFAFVLVWSKYPWYSHNYQTIHLIIYLRNMLIMTQALTKLVYYRNTAVFILQNLRFDLELKMSILQPSQKMENLEVWLDFVKMELLLPEKNLGKIILQCKKVPKKGVTILELFNLVGNCNQLPRQFVSTVTSQLSTTPSYRIIKYIKFIPN